MLPWIFLFIAGVAMLLLATQVFIGKARRIAASLRLSPLIIGLTVVSVGTSLPEMAVSVAAVMEGDSGLAVGNIIGSNIVNIFLVLGVGIAAGRLRIGTTKTQRNTYVLLGATALFLCLYLLGIPQLLSAAILVCSAIAVSFLEYRWGVSGRNREDKKSAMKEGKVAWSHKDGMSVFLAVVGIVAGGLATVEATERLSVILGISTTVLGLSLTAVATSLPELLATVFTVRSHEEKLTVGNIIGSNIYNLLLIGGILLFFTSWSPVTAFEAFTLSAATAVFAFITFSYKGTVIPKYAGVFLLCLFATYIYFLG